MEGGGRSTDSDKDDVGFPVQLSGAFAAVIYDSHQYFAQESRRKAQQNEGQVDDPTEEGSALSETKYTSCDTTSCGAKVYESDISVPVICVK